MNEKLLQELRGIYTKLGGTEDLSAENSLIVILDKIYKQMGGEKELRRFSIPEVVDFIEDKVGEGSGSDFSTAEVTIALKDNVGDYSVPCAFVDDDELLITASGSRGSTFTMLLYKGAYKAYPETWDNESYYPASAISVTGAATVDVEENCVIITGDCTITLDYSQVVPYDPSN